MSYRARQVREMIDSGLLETVVRWEALPVAWPPCVPNAASIFITASLARIQIIMLTMMPSQIVLLLPLIVLSMTIIATQQIIIFHVYYVPGITQTS